LYLTKDLKLKYCKKINTDILDCFVNVDWAGDILDRKSTTGFVVCLEMLYFGSQKNRTV